MRRIFSVPAVALLLALPGTTMAETAHATVGDPAAPAKLPASLVDAYQKGARDISIAPGTYILPSTGQASIELVAWKDAVIHADAVTIVFEELAHRPVELVRCEKVTLEGATLRYAKPAFTQGRIKAIGKDKKGATYVDWQIDAGYPVDVDASRFCTDVVDQTTRLLRVGTGDVGCASSEQLGPGLFRLRGVNGRFGPAKVNDWLFTRTKGGSNVVALEGCSHCTIAKTILQNAGFGAFFESGGEGGNVFRECRVMPAPKPAGATEEELAGCGADGFHSTGTRVGPTIDRCSWEGVLHDDCIAIHGSFQSVVRSEGKKLILVAGNRGSYAVGEPVRISGTAGYFGEFTCLGLRAIKEKVEYQQVYLHRRDGRPPIVLTVKTDSGDKFALNEPVKISGNGSNYGGFICREIRKFMRDDDFLELTLDRESGAPKDTKASNPCRNGAGFKILNCTLGNCRSRGILVKADNGLIEGCTISGCGMSAISIGPEYFWNESDYSRHVAVRGNTLRNNELSGEASGGVFVHGDGAVGNADIAITGNVFDGNYGQRAVHVEDTDGVLISNNRFIASQLPLPGRSRTVLDFQTSKNIKLRANSVENAPAGDSLVTLDKSVEHVDGNDATGISAAAKKCEAK